MHAGRLAAVLLVVAVVGGSLFVTTPARSQPTSAQPSTRFEHRFRIDSERVNAGPISIGAVRGVARGSYALDLREDGHYAIKGGMRGTHFAYKTRLSFEVEGRLDGGAWVPSRYVARIQHDSVLYARRTRLLTRCPSARPCQVAAARLGRPIPNPR